MARISEGDLAGRGIRIGGKLVSGILGIFIPQSSAKEITGGLEDGVGLILDSQGIPVTDQNNPVYLNPDAGPSQRSPEPSAAPTPRRNNRF